MDNQQLSNKIEWKTVQEYDHYEVNQYGEIRHKDRKKNLVKRPNKAGYEYVNFNIQGHRQNFAVHRIVANAFIPNPNYKPEINHKDSNKSNNAVFNLEWVDSSENKIHSYKSGKRATQGKAIEQYSVDGTFLKTWSSATEAALSFGSNNGSAISNCCNGRTKTSMGYKWKFVESSTTKYVRKPSTSAQSSSKEDEDIVSTSSES